ncbi:hypothetical protein [Rhizobium sp. L43]|uniref:hypothetical protein n=1 Tax=Rhizobium sp. L43 TaxID=2035452 RepID=UPI000BE9DE1E|nr:hypothetical protein [Rhizobium sp. L43]PDS79099.1 hypothetical protein CO667_09760 [Rhizobium sp. L43]
MSTQAIQSGRDGEGIWLRGEGVARRADKGYDAEGWGKAKPGWRSASCAAWMETRRIKFDSCDALQLFVL